MADDLVFGLIMNLKKKPFFYCYECGKRKHSVKSFELHDTGLNCHINMYACRKCIKEAKERVKEEDDG